MYGSGLERIFRSPDSVATTTKPSEGLPCGELSFDEAANRLHRMVTGQPDRPPRFHDSYDDPPLPKLEVEPLVTAENPIIKRAADKMTDTAGRFVAEELIPRNIPFPPSERYDVVFSIVSYQQKHGVWVPQFLTFDSTKFETCSAEPVGEGSQQTWNLGTRTTATPEVIVRHAEDVFCTMSTLLKNRENWLKGAHELAQAMKVYQALERSEQTMRRLNSISKQALEASISA